MHSLVVPEASTTTSNSHRGDGHHWMWPGAEHRHGRRGAGERVGLLPVHGRMVGHLCQALLGTDVLTVAKSTLLAVHDGRTDAPLLMAAGAGEHAPEAWSNRAMVFGFSSSASGALISHRCLGD